MTLRLRLSTDLPLSDILYSDYKLTNCPWSLHKCNLRLTNMSGDIEHLIVEFREEYLLRGFSPVVVLDTLDCWTSEEI
jgi:hypothetical protein